MYPLLKQPNWCTTSCDSNEVNADKLYFGELSRQQLIKTKARGTGTLKNTLMYRQLFFNRRHQAKDFLHVPRYCVFCFEFVPTIRQAMQLLTNPLMPLKYDKFTLRSGSSKQQPLIFDWLQKLCCRWNFFFQRLFTCIFTCCNPFLLKHSLFSNN